MSKTVTIVQNRPSIAPLVQTHVPQTRITSTEGCCCCCPCLHTEFLSSQPGLCKIGEVIFGTIGFLLTVGYGTPVWLMLGLSYGLFIITSAAAVLGSAIFLFAYLISAHTFRVLRSTVLETIQNGVAGVLYLCASSFLITQISFLLWPLYLITPFFQPYPALMAAAVCGYACAFVHGIDTFYAFREMWSRR